MASPRKINPRQQKWVQDVRDSLGARTAAAVLGVKSTTLTKWSRGEGRVSERQQKRIAKVSDPKMINFLGRLKQRSEETRWWRTKRGKAVYRTNKQIDEALADIVDESKPGKSKRDAAKNTEFGATMDRLGIPLSGPQAEYLNRRRKYKSGAAKRRRAA